MRTIRLVPTLLLAGSMATIALADQPRSLKHVTVYVDGDRHVIPQFIDTSRKLGPEHGLEFTGSAADEMEAGFNRTSGCYPMR